MSKLLVHYTLCKTIVLNCRVLTVTEKHCHHTAESRQIYKVSQTCTVELSVVLPATVTPMQWISQTWHAPDNKLNKFQRIQNHAARLVLCKSRHANATALLRTLHWLPVKSRIQYKIACLCFQCICHNSMPPCTSDLLHPCYPSRTLRSLDTSLLTVPCFSLETFGKR